MAIKKIDKKKIEQKVYLLEKFFVNAIPKIPIKNKVILAISKKEGFAMSSALLSKKVFVLGAGNFGTCLASHLARVGHDVLLWSRDESVANCINKEHRNPKYLKDFTLPESLKSTSDISLMQAAQAVVLAIPTQALREVLTKAPKLNLDQLIISTVKGIEIGSLKFPIHIIEDLFGKNLSDQTVVLSGPSFAVEVIGEQPSAVSAASKNEDACLMAQALFHSPFFRVYTSKDPIGLEVAGALKNIIAIAAGACAGLGYQNNSRAAIITRGLSEMTRIGVALGANPLTFIGLGGIGDLLLTCSSEKSRNFTVGYRMGRGEKLQQVLSTMDSVAEGVTTTKSAYQLASVLKVSHPITKAVFQVLYEEKPIKDAVLDLITRDAKPES